MKDLGVKPYWAFFSIYWQDLKGQRFETLTQLASLPFSIIAISALWISLELAGYPGFGGFDTRELILYAMIGAVIRKLVNNASVANFVEDDITEGSFMVNLCRPIEHWKYRLSLRLAGVAILAPIAILIIVAVFWWFNATVPAIQTILLVGLLLFMGFIFSFFEYYMIGILSFWLERVWGFRYGFDIMESFISGMIFPLTIFPAFIQGGLHILPFGHAVYTPTALLLGKISMQQGIEGLLILSAWTVFAFVLAKTMWKFGLRKYDGKM